MSKVIHEIKNQYINCFLNNKFFLFMIFSAFFVGVLIAIIYLITFREILSFKNIIDNPLYLYIKQDINLFSFFIRRFFNLLLIISISFLICTNKITKYFYLLLSIYLGYLLVFNMGIIIISFGFFGVLYALIITLVFGIVYFLIITLVVLNCNECLLQNKFLYNIKYNWPVFITLVIILFVISLLEMILMPLFSSTFIINYL